MMKIKFNPILNAYQLFTGCAYITFDEIKVIGKDVITLYRDRNHVGGIKADENKAFTKELRLADTAKVARELAQNSAAIHSAMRERVYEICEEQATMRAQV